MPTNPTPRLLETYRGPIRDKLRQEQGITNPLAMPRLQKIVLNVGLGHQLEGTKINPRAKQQVIEDLTRITGQKPVMKTAKKAVSNFKVRRGFEIGVMVTLRGARMWEFLDRLINISIPRIKDFRGLNGKSMDGWGNYSFGVHEQAIFPEVDMSNAQFTHGMNMNFVFENSSDQLSHLVLRELGMPFRVEEGEAEATAQAA